LHLDLVGPFEVPSYGNAKYFLTIVDDHSRKIFICFLKQKGDTYENNNLMWHMRIKLPILLDPGKLKRCYSTSLIMCHRAVATR
jgi:hypothetical protein